MGDAVLTVTERERVKAYEKICADQIQRDREYAERPLKKTLLTDILGALEN